jgi:hypothetical protein
MYQEGRKEKKNGKLVLGILRGGEQMYYIHPVILYAI